MLLKEDLGCEGAESYFNELPDGVNVQILIPSSLLSRAYTMDIPQFVRRFTQS